MAIHSTSQAILNEDFKGNLSPMAMNSQKVSALLPFKT